MKKHLFTLCALLISTVAFAQNWREIQSGEVCSLHMFQTSYWKITAKQNGIATISPTEETKSSSMNSYSVYGDANRKEVITTNWDFGTNTLSFSVTAGKTYYIVVDPWASWDFFVTMPGEGGSDTSFKIVESIPADGGVLNYGDEYVAEITFSAPVTFSRGTLSCGECSTGIYLYTDYNRLIQEGIFTYTEDGATGRTNYNGNLLTPVQGNTITIPATSDTGLGYRNIIKEWVDAGKAKEGDAVTIHIDGVTCTLNNEKYNGDGVLEMTFTLGAMPTTLVSADVPEVINSWFVPGDPNGVATFIFSKDIRSARAFLEMGQGEGADDLYTEEIDSDHITYDGNQVKVDFSGVMRTYKTMALKNAWPSFTLTLTSVYDVDGQPTYSPDKGSASTYTYTCRYIDVSTVITYEIIPENGSVITADDKEVEIWFDNGGFIEYDGVSITYYTDDDEYRDVFIPNSELKINIESDGSVTLLCPLPEGLWQYKNICVQLNVIGANDGLDHVIAAYYNTSLMYGLEPELTADPVSESTVNRLSEIYLTLGFVYAINENLADKVKVTSKTNPGYKGTAKIVSAGMTNAKIVLDEPISEAGQYTIEVPKGVLGDYNYGKSRYTSGTTHEAFTLEYTVNGKWAGKSVVCYPEEGVVNSLKTFTITFFDYVIAPTWNTEKRAYVEKVPAAGEEPVTFAGDFIYDAETGATNDIVFELVDTITVPGEYDLVIPAGALANGATGDEFDTALTFHFTVGNASAISNITAADGAKTGISTLSGVKLNKATAPGLYIINGKKVIIK